VPRSIGVADDLSRRHAAFEYSSVVQDTSPTAQGRYDELLRAQTPAQRIAIAVSLSRSVRELAVAGIRAARPNASPSEVDAELAARMYGPEVAARLFSRRRK
jgi:hypothetical protein